MKAQIHFLAADAWNMIWRPVNPMPLWAAIDFVQNGGCERADAFREICYRAASFLQTSRPPCGEHIAEITAELVRAIAKNRTDRARFMRSKIPHNLTGPEGMFSRRWFDWIVNAWAAIEICESLAELVPLPADGGQYLDQPA